MPKIYTTPPPYRSTRAVVKLWSTFRKGLNLLQRPTELTDDEYMVGDNIMLTGAGIPTVRWGTAPYFTAGATGTIRGLGSYINSQTSVNEILAVTDQGNLVKRSGTTSTTIAGITFPSGTDVRFIQLGGYTYVVSKATPFAQYNGTLSVFATIPRPVNLQASLLTGATGTHIWSWRVTARSVQGGQTDPSVNVQLNNLTYDISSSRVRIAWSMPSHATISGFEIYRGVPGYETYLTSVGPSVRDFIDEGYPTSARTAPLTNTTGGVKSAIIAKYIDRLLLVPSDDRSKLIITGRYPKQTSTSWVDGGGYVYVDPDSGEDIVGIGIQPGSNKIVVYKNNSHYEVSIGYVSVGNEQLLDPQVQPISTSIGASSPDTIQVVENDIFYFGRKGLYVTGYEPNFLSVIRTNEVSARIRPYLATLTKDDYETACAMYINNKYLLSFPLKKHIVVYDRERGAFAGIWKLPYGISKMLKHTDENGVERWIIGSANSNNVYVFSESSFNDSGQTINVTFQTGKVMFNSWSDLKIITFFASLFRRVQGEMQVNILAEDKNGVTSTIKSFTILGASFVGNSGWGASLWGEKTWGTPSGTVVLAADEQNQWTLLYNSARLVQIEVKTTTLNSSFELLGFELRAQAQPDATMPTIQKI